MPDSLLDSRSEFDRSKLELGRYLRGQHRNVRPLEKAEVDAYGSYDFVSGWAIDVESDTDVDRFEVLIDGRFPYSRLRVAYRSQDVYLKWPHVETQGVLCLPLDRPPSADVSGVAFSSILAATELVAKCADAAFVRQELGREFISYWNRSCDDATPPIRSLLDPTNRATRDVAVWLGKHYALVGETPAQLQSWLANLGREGNSAIVTGVFGFLDEAPVPQFPSGTREFFDFLQAHCPQALQRIDVQPAAASVVVVLGADSPTGIGLIGARIDAPGMNGFRKGATLSATIKRRLRASRSRFTRAKLDRFDPSWIHGRGLSQDQKVLESADILVLGCGSLGSQVAVRLAQCGVGSMWLVDPEKLAAANVGRHALGVESVGRNKATELAKVLKRRFPHVRDANGFAGIWQSFVEKHGDIIDQFDLVIACIGDWASDGQLSEWYVKGHVPAPIVIGWLDEFGTAAHAVALSSGVPALTCLLDSEGRLREPETLWPAGGQIQAEPACGTLFQPFGALDVARAEGLVTRLCLDIATGQAKTPAHRVSAAASADILAAGGEWSPSHANARPSGFDGPFEYERRVVSCGVCAACINSQ